MLTCICLHIFKYSIGNYKNCEAYITCTILKISSKSFTKLSGDRLFNLLPTDEPPPETELQNEKTLKIRVTMKPAAF